MKKNPKVEKAIDTLLKNHWTMTQTVSVFFESKKKCIKKAGFVYENNRVLYKPERIKC